MVLSIEKIEQIREILKDEINDKEFFEMIMNNIISIARSDIDKKKSVEACQRYYSKNKDKIKGYSKDYYQRNKEHIKELALKRKENLKKK